MRIFGLPIPFTSQRSTLPAVVEEKAYSGVYENRGGWYPLIREMFTGAWQRNATPIDQNLVLSYHAVYACMTLIASDIAKLRVKLVQQDSTGIWTETTNPAYSPVIRKPNRYQNRIQFWESWVLSKLQRGNAYMLKERDGRGVVTDLYVLDPNRVKPLISDDGEVYYQLSADNLSGIENDVTVPAKEIIHDRFNCLFHPLVGTSPIYACGLAATQGLNIQNSSSRLFANNSQPGGILTAPGKIGKETGERLKADWEEAYTGRNLGRVAVLGDGLKYESMAITAVEAQLIDQLKWSAETVCSAFHVPPYKIGIGTMPTYNNIQSLNVEYYSQCLQRLIEDSELCLDEGLEMGTGIGTEFDTDNLLRMDSVTQMDVLDKAKSILTPDEQRAYLNKKPTVGGDVVYRQQQDFSLAALAKRDAQDDPFATSSGGGGSKKPPQQTDMPAPDDMPANDNTEAQSREALITIMKGLA